ncbi:uncharacterized protein LOC111911121 [Lactuca sativa]|uniref:Uncharacterized protein n=1 Tax=Lactuca sativa TaxID=4236 RepID=A0A9R1UKL9_LACSA|nr:uncharacterized protein LOC111911121 [Lactuca sativa]KAJ0189046.1 hypothetical protein LSAT_V11C800397990 [Lactuca sativa]
MAEKGASMVRKPEDESSGPPNPLLSVISKFTKFVNSRFPPPPAEKDVVKVETESKGSGDSIFRSSEVVEPEASKPVVVRFPDARTTTVPPLKVEAEELEQDTNPVVLWQVYAIGGFFVLRWVLARWKERRANKKKSNENSPPPPTASASGADE